MHNTTDRSMRFHFAGLHLLLSAVVVGVIAIWMFLVWYPQPFRSLSGGLHLFGILVVVDLMLGPLATLVVSNPGKSRREWRRDMAFIVVVQVAAMGYGSWTVYQARPVYMAFEIDRFRTIQAIDVPVELLPQAPADYQSLPMMGPKLVAVRPFRNETERTDVTLAALQGIHLGARPDLWLPYDQALTKIREEAKPIMALLSKRPDHAFEIKAAIQRAAIPDAAVTYLPVAGHEDFWTVLIDARSGYPIAYLPIDPY